MEVVFILWWTGVIRFRNLIPHMGALTVSLAPEVRAWFWPVLAYSAFEVVINLIGLLRPGWLWLNAGLSLARSLAGMALAAGLLQLGHWVSITADLPAGALDLAQMNFDLGVKIALVVTVAGFAIKGAIDAHRLWQVTQDAKAPLSPIAL